MFGMGDAADVEDGWEDRWRKFHRPVRVGRLWVGPPWETPPADALAVVIDPGRAFGTGAHPTTQLCLELLQELEPGSLLDVGCGSGVLSVARRAARLRAGARRRHRGAVDRGDARECRAERRRARRAARGRRRARSRRRGRPSRTSRSTRSQALPGRIDAQVLLTSGYFPRSSPSSPATATPSGARTTAGPRICTAARQD